MTEDLMKAYHSAIIDCWQLFKRNIGSDNWDRIVSEADMIVKKYSFDKFVCKMACAVVEELERLSHREE